MERGKSDQGFTLKAETRVAHLCSPIHVVIAPWASQQPTQLMSPRCFICLYCCYLTGPGRMLSCRWMCGQTYFAAVDKVSREGSSSMQSRRSGRGEEERLSPAVCLPCQAGLQHYSRTVSAGRPKSPSPPSCYHCWESVLSRPMLTQ